MRNRTAYHSREGYKDGSGAACFGVLRCTSPRRSGFARPLARNPRGFTLVEVIVASAILMVLLLTLMGSFAAGVSGFKQAQQMTFAQNLGEFLAEDLKARPPGVLKQLCEGTWDGVSEWVYPVTAKAALSNYPLPPVDDAEAQANNARPFEYDSGKQQTDYSITGVDLVLGTDPDGDSFVYRAGGTSAPTLPTNPPLLLGSNVGVLTYELNSIDPYDPENSTHYYVVKLHREAYPLFTKQVRLVCYDAWMSSTVDPWTHATGDAVAYHFMHDPYDGSEDTMTGYHEGMNVRLMFSYIITVRYERGTTSRVLYETRGVISAPYDPPDGS
jgi:prepilin-type N-terminal cleavage/methylation domain-containing protein